MQLYMDGAKTVVSDQCSVVRRMPDSQDHLSCRALKTTLGWVDWG